MSLSFTVRQGPARLAQRLPELTKSAFQSPLRSFHYVSRQPPPATKTIAPSSFFTASRVASSTARSSGSIARHATGARFYNQGAQMQPQNLGASSGNNAWRRMLVGGAIFGGTLVAINTVFNMETREDGGMLVFEREYLNNTFLHTGLGIGIIGLTARQMVQTGFVYRLMVTSPWVVAIGGLALSFGTMIATRSIAPDK